MKSSLSNKSNLFQRILTGVLGAAIMISSIYLNQWSFVTLLFILNILTMYEFYSLIDHSGVKSNRILGIMLGAIFFSMVVLIEKNIIGSDLLLILIPLSFFCFLVELFQQKNQPFTAVSHTFLGILYIAIPYSLLAISSFINGEYHYEIITGILLMVWANDIGGYVFGLNFGKHKLFERISPKKTWEGTIGGIITCLAIAWALSYLFEILLISDWLILAITISLFGSLGDLVESLLKRSLQIKDSGTMLPGHGGFLDRFDALIFVAPFIAFYLKIFI